MPLAIDLFCGLGGWTEGLLAESYDVIGFDIEAHCYGDHRYPAQLVLQDALTLHGSQFRDATLIVASPPCQAYSYRAMPWRRAKALPPPDNTLFEACFRIQREASEAAGRHIPMVVENVRGAQPWVGRARWNYGSYYLWGDVPALMPPIGKFKSSGMNWSNREIKGQDFTRIAGNQAIKVPSFRSDGSGRSLQTASVRRTDAGNGVRFTSRDCGVEGVKNGAAGENCSAQRTCGSKSINRKAASAMIAKIPLPLARHIAAVYKAS
jgi:hypothetical protein